MFQALRVCPYSVTPSPFLYLLPQHLSLVLLFACTATAWGSFPLPCWCACAIVHCILTSSDQPQSGCLVWCTKRKMTNKTERGEEKKGAVGKKGVGHNKSNVGEEEKKKKTTQQRGITESGGPHIIIFPPLAEHKGNRVKEVLGTKRYININKKHTT